jgi:hypothetical protein
LHQAASFDLPCAARISPLVSIERYAEKATNEKFNLKKAQEMHKSPLAGTVTTDVIQTKFGKVGVPQNVITFVTFYR